MIKNKKRLLAFISTAVILIFIFIPASHSQASNQIPLTELKKTMKIGEIFTLGIKEEQTTEPTFKSSDTKIASVNALGQVTAKKAGTATITVKIKKRIGSCQITVKPTVITLEQEQLFLEHGDTAQVKVKTSNQSKPVFYSSHNNVALVDRDGMITARKPGETVITVQADGSQASLIVTVNHPMLKLSNTNIQIKKGEKYTLAYVVSSGQAPSFRTNRKNIVLVDEKGTITAVNRGTAVITATVDGVSRVCEVVVY